MPGRGPTAKAGGRRRRNAPERGEWQASPGVGWQHGDVPVCPAGLLKASKDAWHTWLTSWFAAHWMPEDLPALRQIVRLYDQVERGEFVRAGELRLWMDTFGISKKGQQDRRWMPPVVEIPAPKADKPVSAYAHLRVVNE